MQSSSAGVTRVAIVGGGTAGWMAAAMLSKLMGEQLKITLLESDDIATVRVGEATIPSIKSFNQSLGIDEAEFVRATQGTFKLAIEFENWGSLGNRYMHAFGGIGQDLGSSFQHYWRRSLSEGIESDFWDFSLNCQAARQHKFSRAPKLERGALPGMSYAYHFDANLYAQYLRAFSETNGVERIEGKVVRASLNSESGFIESLTTASGNTIGADLFIDCSGFRGLLIEEALHTGYEDWTNWLPCDRAVALPSESTKPPPPYTRAIAHAAGWQWCVPLQHRTGNGLVYCSRYLSDEAATETLLDHLDGSPLGDPRILTFTTGRRLQQWNKNCIALGLSSGFIEPLESTSIHLIQSGITRLVAMFPGKAINQVEIDEYNRQSAIEFERIRDFIILHYHVNQRTDSDFWTECRNTKVPESLSRKIRLFEAGGKVFREHNDLFSKVAWLQVMIGQGIIPRDYHPVVSQISSTQLAEFLGNMRTAVNRTVQNLPSHQDVIANQCRAEPDL
jgi:tryptophan halogenase